MLKVKITKKFDDFKIDKEWEVGNGEVISLYGPSGSGKSITIQSVAGLINPDYGFIEIDKKIIYDKEKNICIPPKDRHIGYVPQNYGLFPHMKVIDNIIFGMKDKDRDLKIRKAIDLLRITGLDNKKDKYPMELSGGQKQRVAIMRALATNPKVLLLDEPFSALDINVKENLRKEIKRFFSYWNIPVVLVTHDKRDVEVLANKIAYY
ncbi:ATP-binding cassette domain-containing protein [Serpentinicella alkaliphila]|uniref:Molybdate transport system ATP-binding protein n=1 Tax=Serpentinicella alkaliphila TaxID=1734049 RepID=A0A4R2TMH6_9FIRM|nr:ATP-binding cassette domain-containing protein [Serpentinicella alkaliphila]QUH24741.1 ATP-binding cassette domain-containing protein [Serpentinicella alkaliphila]TCQ03732.1 molybdate transport system ATP-binding protein [Serpentinicella alkaliphila]